MKLLTILLIALSVCGCASNPWSRQWGTKARIEQTLQEKLPLGSSRETILAFFKKEGIKVVEMPPLALRKKHTLTVSFQVSWLMVPPSDVLVSFELGPDGKSVKMTFSEQLAGWL